MPPPLSRSPKSTLPVQEKMLKEPELIPPTALPVIAADPTSPNNEINLKVQQAQELLLDLKRQQEEIERQKKELEELGRKQREFSDGRREVVEKLTRGLVLLERQDFEVKRELEQIKIIRDSFMEQLSVTEGLRPEEAPGDEMSSELTRSLARVDQAKSIYNQARARLVALRQQEEGGAGEISSDLGPEYAEAPERSFARLVQEGFAYSLPLIVTLGIIGLVLFLHH